MSEISRLEAEVSQLETAAKGTGLIPAMSKIFAPLTAGFKDIGKYLGIGIAGIAVIYLFTPMILKRIGGKK